MDKVMAEGYYKVIFHFENIPDFFHNVTKKEFMKNYNVVADLFNELIDQANYCWSLKGIKACGDDDELINPEYTKFINDYMQPHLDILNNMFSFCKYKLGEYCDITGYLPFIKNSKVWITLERVF